MAGWSMRMVVTPLGIVTMALYICIVEIMQAVNLRKCYMEAVCGFLIRFELTRIAIKSIPLICLMEVPLSYIIKMEQNMELEPLAMTS